MFNSADHWLLIEIIADFKLKIMTLEGKRQLNRVNRIRLELLLIMIKFNTMKKLVLFSLLILSFISCKEASTVADKVSMNDKAQMVAEKAAIDYPADLDKVFDNHGSVDKWKAMKALTFEIVKEGGNEKTMTDLYNRHERIEAASATTGFTGEKYWVEADTSYKGNPKFYTNLMFYFYAMPFVLTDDGINYTKAEPLVFEDKSYPGYRISYGDGVGISPKDEYFIHYDPQTYEMAWLGYTVTFSSGKASDKISWIRYDDWAQINGLKLPQSMSWFKTEENKPTEKRNTRTFANVKVSETAFSAGTFDMPAGAKEFE